MTEDGGWSLCTRLNEETSLSLDLDGSGVLACRVVGASVGTTLPEHGMSALVG
jgi:hypothetical protein